jgi:hypothetical protein
VTNDIGGSICIVAGRDGEVHAAEVATGIGTTLEAARIEADRHITLTNDLAALALSSMPGLRGQRSVPHALLHVMVPADADLPNVRTHDGNIEIYGRVGSITATITGSGDLEVYGADGNLTLTTQRGSISVDILNDHNLALRAAGGNIDIKALETVSGTRVLAATTNGNINFLGTLRAGQSHQFIITGTGNIHVAVPAYPDGHPVPQVYRFNVSTSASPVNVEYPAMGSGARALAICGFIHSRGPYDYHVENTQANSGRIEVSPVLTGTYFFSGTLATDYFRFDTNQMRVSFYTPIAQSIHIYTAAQLNEIIAGREPIAPDCRAALSAPSDKAIAVTLKTDRGIVSIHHTIMR